jgi:plastocyanin
MGTTRVRIVGAALAILVIALSAAACGGDDSGEPSDGSDPGGGAGLPHTAALSIADLAFEPSTLPIAAGSTEITITNADTTNHTFTLDDGAVDQPVDAGQTEKVTVEAGSGETIGYHCEIHSTMTGTLQVA